jgi:formamidopyrimidine-DNA glycosylase
VETVVRSLRPHIVGQTIERAELRSRRVTRADLQQTARALERKVITGLRRQGKQIFFDLDAGVLYIHLGMTGKLLWNGTPGKYSRAILHLTEGMLLYDDIRQFGRVEYFETLPQAFGKVGPDALLVDFEEFYSRLHRHACAVKTLLLNQSFISGVGNIYADEALFAARIHPRTSARRISKGRARELHASVADILQTAIKHRGSSISDYVDSSGARGSFQNMHSVYARAGMACLRCGATIRRIVLGQRGTHYCPRCQRA